MGPAMTRKSPLDEMRERVLCALDDHGTTYLFPHDEFTCCVDVMLAALLAGASAVVLHRAEDGSVGVTPVEPSGWGYDAWRAVVEP